MTTPAMSSSPLAAVSTKAYFGLAQTHTWVTELAGLAPLTRRTGVEVAVLPSFPFLASTGQTLAGTGMTWGAQDIAASPDGAQTGEVLGSMLADLGCRYAEIGHAERRRLFGEGDSVIQHKTRSAIRAGLVPLICVGEAEEGSAADAARQCLAQAVAAIGEDDEAELVLAYEPVWAIGADQPAPIDHIRTVTSVLRGWLRERRGRSRLIYGGTAGPGLATELGGAVDGLFLGRRAHQIAALAQVIEEIAAIRPVPTTS